MKNILLTLLLISPLSFADWGDVYYCQMTNYVAVSLDGEKTNYKRETFKLKLDKDKNAMVFAGSHYFSGTVIPIVIDSSSFDTWVSQSEYNRASIRKGKFLFTANHYTIGVTVISADCDKF
jgi:hypothetical protein